MRFHLNFHLQLILTKKYNILINIKHFKQVFKLKKNVMSNLSKNNNNYNDKKDSFSR